MASSYSTYLGKMGPTIDFDHVKFGVMAKRDWREERRKRKRGLAKSDHLLLFLWPFHFGLLSLFLTSYTIRVSARSSFINGVGSTKTETQPPVPSETLTPPKSIISSI